MQRHSATYFATFGTIHHHSPPYFVALGTIHQHSPTYFAALSAIHHHSPPYFAAFNTIRHHSPTYYARFGTIRHHSTTYFASGGIIFITMRTNILYVFALPNRSKKKPYAKFRRKRLFVNIKKTFLQHRKFHGNQQNISRSGL